MRKVRAPIAERCEKQDVIVAAGDDEVDALPLHDFDDSPAERLGIGNRLCNEVDRIEVEKRGLVRDTRRRDQRDAITTLRERAQHVLAHLGPCGEDEETMCIHRAKGSARGR